MKKSLFIALMSVLLLLATSLVQAQELHCNRAIRKDWKSHKKDCKIHKKMFHDREAKAAKKYFKSDKKECKAEGKEYIHRLTPNHDGPEN